MCVYIYCRIFYTRWRTHHNNNEKECSAYNDKLSVAKWRIQMNKLNAIFELRRTHSSPISLTNEMHIHTPYAYTLKVSCQHTNTHSLCLFFSTLTVPLARVSVRCIGKKLRQTSCRASELRPTTAKRRWLRCSYMGNVLRHKATRIVEINKWIEINTRTEKKRHNANWDTHTLCARERKR